MNSPMPTTEIVGDDNKENSISSIPKSTDIQELSSTVKPGASPADTKSIHNDDDEMDATAHPSSVASRFMNVLHSPAPRQSIGKNVGDLKRPAEVTPVPNTTIAAKRSRHVTPKRISKLPVSTNDDHEGQVKVKRQSSPKRNFFRDVYDLLEQSTVENPKLFRWTEDGKGFAYGDKNRVKLTQWLTKFDLPKWESFRRRLNIYGFHKNKPLKNKIILHDHFHRGLKEADIDRLYQLHLDDGPVRSKANMKKKAVASTPTRATTTMVVTASKKVLKALKKSPVVKKMNSAAVTPKPSGVNETFELSEVPATPLEFTAELVAQSNDSVGVTTPVAIKRPTSYSPSGWPSSLPLGVLMDAALGGYPHVNSLPFDSEVESAAAGGICVTKQVSSAPFVSPTGCVPVEWSSLPLATLADTALGLDHYQKILSLDALVSPCKRTKKASAVGPTLDDATLLAQDSVTTPSAGMLFTNLTHDQGVLIKMSFSNGVSAFTTSPVDAAVWTATGDVDVSSRLACMESVQYPSTPTVSAAASCHDCPATPFKWSGEEPSAFSPISITAGKGDPCPPSTAFKSLLNMPADALSLRLGELANLSDDDLLVGQVEAV